jgi:hypothetical protein
MVRVVDVSLEVLIEEPGNILFSDDISSYKFAMKEFFLRKIPQFMAEPLINWDTESHFRPIHHLVRDDAAQRFFQDIFLIIETFQLEVEGDLGRKLEEDMVEEG